MVKVVGIDPGLAETGVGIIWGTAASVAGFAHGTIRTDKRQDQAHRLACIHEQLLSVLREETPQLMLVEGIFSLGRYPVSGISLGKVTGVVLLAGSQAAVPAVEVQVREVKRVLTGNGNASKDQVETAVRRYLKLSAPIRPFHVSDALALALLGMFRFQTLMTGCRLDGLQNV